MYFKKVTIIALLIFVFAFMQCCTTNENQTLNISKREYHIKVGDVVKLDGVDDSCDIDVIGKSIYIDNGVITANSKGLSKVIVKKGKSQVLIKVYVYDAIVHNGGSINDALSDVSSGSSIYVQRGMYDENIVVDKDISIEGDRDTFVKGMVVDNGADVYVRQMQFYTRSVMGSDDALLIVGTECSVHLVSCSFTSDVKEDIVNGLYS